MHFLPDIRAVTLERVRHQGQQFFKQHVVLAPGSERAEQFRQHGRQPHILERAKPARRAARRGGILVCRHAQQGLAPRS
ncbi:hypothetical protein LP419_40230 [Massilia sp. H-1]|nr:hypothetical protein LP419_40230 [Massilia sp. H-1]